MIHELKIIPPFFEDIVSRAKQFEVRKNDRDYSVGDFLALNEYDPERERYTGRSALVSVMYLLDNPKFCKDGCVILGFSACAIEIARPRRPQLLQTAEAVSELMLSKRAKRLLQAAGLEVCERDMRRLDKGDITHEKR